jgi:hypothetical protein
MRGLRPLETTPEIGPGGLTSRTGSGGCAAIEEIRERGTAKRLATLTDDANRNLGAHYTGIAVGRLVSESEAPPVIT